MAQLKDVGFSASWRRKRLASRAGISTACGLASVATRAVAEIEALAKVHYFDHDRWHA
jgi:hypothetical protein